jgi:hypothetical protein
MVTIFAARTANGESRFIGEVGRGSACACFCIVCGSLLVAKQGEELEWHFAHEAGNERPECPAGAMNLLRRLALEELQKLTSWPAQPFSRPHPVPGRAPLTWSATPTGQFLIAESGGPDEPAGYVTLVEGATASIHVCIGREPPPAARQGDAIAVLWCPETEGVQIRTEQDARAFVREKMALRWLSLPDFSGLLVAAKEEARLAADRLRLQQEALQRARAAEAGARWAQKRRALLADPADPGATDQANITAAVTSGSMSSVPRSASPAWAQGLEPGGSIHYRRLDDGSQWVCYPVAGKKWRLRAVPHAFDGWDETFPPTVAVAAKIDGVLEVVNFDKLLLLFNKHAVESQIDSDPRVIERRFDR